MRYRQTDRALACIGAIIGAGFASGREIMAFFTQYGILSWALIGVAVATMSALFLLTMRRLRAFGNTGEWCAIYENHPGWLRFLGEGCMLLLMAIIGGAMISASGELVALVLPVHGAYPLGTLATLMFSWILSQKSIKPLAAISGFLTLALLAAYLLVMVNGSQAGEWVAIERPLRLPWVGRAFLSVIAYCCMNMAISLGVVCECAQTSVRKMCRTVVWFAAILTALLLMCNYVLQQHPELQSAAFPIVQLLSRLGQGGFYLSALVLYLAVFTTSIAVLRTLRKMAECHLPQKWWQGAVTLGTPLLFSVIGFAGIVEGVYPAIGLVCLVFVFLPIVFPRRKTKTASTHGQGESGRGRA